MAGVLTTLNTYMNLRFWIFSSSTIDDPRHGNYPESFGDSPLFSHFCSRYSHYSVCHVLNWVLCLLFGCTLPLPCFSRALFWSLPFQASLSPCLTFVRKIFWSRASEKITLSSPLAMVAMSHHISSYNACIRQSLHMIRSHYDQGT